MVTELAGQDAQTSVSRPTERTASGRKFRPELQGLRALAVVLVIVYHVWLDRVSGGVDVFIMISGFLLTGQLTRAVTRGRIEFRPLWGRMVKRLFPAALTVLVAVMAVSLIVLPEPRWFQTIREVVAAALYFENWQLAADSVDYFAQNNGKSPVQHFWSLSIQGQLFIALPLLIVLVGFLARRLGGGLRIWVAGTLGVVGAASLAYSIYLTAVNQPLAYFNSFTRIWEFVLGGLLALFVDSITLPRLVRVVLGWLGVAALVSCGLLLHVGTVFPGYAALWPTLAAAMVLLAGATESRAGADRFLSSRPLRYVGDISYSLYLWHWPVLIFYLAYRDIPRVGIKGGAMIIGVSFVLAMLTHRFVEEPARTSRYGEKGGWGAYKFGIVLLVPVLALAGTWQFATAKRAEFAFTINDPDHPGAAARYPGFRYQGAEDVEAVPPPVAIPDDWGSSDGMDCAADPGYGGSICTTRVEGAPVKRVVAIGDSHMQQFLPALRPIAEKRHWELTFFLKGACPFSTDVYIPEPQDCSAWNTLAHNKILDMKPDAVFTQATRDARVGLTEQTPSGYLAEWQALVSARIPVVAVRDTPRHAFDPPACAQVHGPEAPQCSSPRLEMFSPTPPWLTLSGIPDGVKFVDLTDYLCAETTCPPIIGNVWVYRDFNHPTATYMRTLSPIVEEQLLTALKW
ncbi:MAG: acyltransferase family protein [Actinophytocola sp.]|uniref:acyltransferase family protein n=1 Tax=Actinophytocola sp. TaxID=1872138 RepID=UPI003C785AD4